MSSDSRPQASSASLLRRVGVVVIGRNEGERLIAGLRSIPDGVGQVVYVDSGSTDGSLEAAAAVGATTVALDMSRPFTAARARNAGARALAPSIEFIQFMDGDCMLAADWIFRAAGYLIENPLYAVVCGRRREAAPTASIYNALCDEEWNTPVGEAYACGGDALFRADEFRRVGGFCDDLIAGEEPELCLRLRERGARIMRLDAEMTLHDAAIHGFGQWWRRTLRGGFAFAEVSRIHRRSPMRIWAKEARRALLWAAIAPASLIAALAVTPWALGALLIYPAQIVRLAQRAPSHAPNRWRRAMLLVAAKFAEAIGVLRYHRGRFGARKPGLIEYKAASK